MGFIKTAKQNSITREAQEAWSQGRMFFTPVLNMPHFVSGFSGDIADIGLMTEAIVVVGWRLHTWAAVSDKNGRPQIMPLFVR